MMMDSDLILHSQQLAPPEAAPPPDFREIINQTLTSLGINLDFTSLGRLISSGSGHSWVHKIFDPINNIIATQLHFSPDAELGPIQTELTLGLLTLLFCIFMAYPEAKYKQGVLDLAREISAYLRIRMREQKTHRGNKDQISGLPPGGDLPTPPGKKKRWWDRRALKVSAVVGGVATVGLVGAGAWIQATYNGGLFGFAKDSLMALAENISNGDQDVYTFLVRFMDRVHEGRVVRLEDLQILTEADLAKRKEEINLLYQDWQQEDLADEAAQLLLKHGNLATAEPVPYNPMQNSIEYEPEIQEKYEAYVEGPLEELFQEDDFVQLFASNVAEAQRYQSFFLNMYWQNMIGLSGLDARISMNSDKPDSSQIAILSQKSVGEINAAIRSSQEFLRTLVRKVVYNENGTTGSNVFFKVIEIYNSSHPVHVTIDDLCVISDYSLFTILLQSVDSVSPEMLNLLNNPVFGEYSIKDYINFTKTILRVNSLVNVDTLEIQTLLLAINNQQYSDVFRATIDNALALSAGEDTDVVAYGDFFSAKYQSTEIIGFLSEHNLMDISIFKVVSIYDRTRDPDIYRLFLSLKRAGVASEEIFIDILLATKPFTQGIDDFSDIVGQTVDQNPGAYIHTLMVMDFINTNWGYVNMETFQRLFAFFSSKESNYDFSMDDVLLVLGEVDFSQTEFDTTFTFLNRVISRLPSGTKLSRDIVWTVQEVRSRSIIEASQFTDTIFPGLAQVLTDEEGSQIGAVMRVDPNSAQNRELGEMATENILEDERGVIAEPHRLIGGDWQGLYPCWEPGRDPDARFYFEDMDQDDYDNYVYYGDRAIIGIKPDGTVEVKHFRDFGPTPTQAAKYIRDNYRLAWSPRLLVSEGEYAADAYSGSQILGRFLLVISRGGQMYTVFVNDGVTSLDAIVAIERSGIDAWNIAYIDPGMNAAAVSPDGDTYNLPGNGGNGAFLVVKVINYR